MPWMPDFERIFGCLLILQFLLVVSHDWLEIPGWTHGSQVRTVVGTRKLLIATVVNAVFPAAAVWFAVSFWQHPKPVFVRNYWLIYCAVTVASAIAMWHIPYLFGASDRQRSEYERMYAGTRQVLPDRNGNPRPNLLHLCFHALFAANLSLAVIVRFWSM